MCLNQLQDIQSVNPSVAYRSQMQIRGRLTHLESSVIHLSLAHVEDNPKSYKGSDHRHRLSFPSWEFYSPVEEAHSKKLRKDYLLYHFTATPIQSLRHITTSTLQNTLHQKRIISKKFYCTSAYKALTPTQPERLCFVRPFPFHFLKVLKPTIFTCKTLHPPTPQMKTKTGTLSAQCLGTQCAVFSIILNSWGILI